MILIFASQTLINAIRSELKNLPSEYVASTVNNYMIYIKF
jgi:hypothetical protein